jgi:hypothetical protein
VLRIAGLDDRFTAFLLSTSPATYLHHYLEGPLIGAEPREE